MKHTDLAHSFIVCLGVRHYIVVHIALILITTMHFKILNMVHAIMKGLAPLFLSGALFNTFLVAILMPSNLFYNLTCT